MGEEPGLSVPRQRLFHMRPRLLGATRCGQCPGQCIMCKNVCARLQLALGEFDCELDLLTAGSQEE